ncbi:HipA N-terminal domain-containing protein [Paenarthrobacter nitroguajacolicus]|uniref:HipA N-terminal domain-containing protein n=1 Tax=Paenarthrobacter nitroguajacolicus TaxID=211146 RepID=UPI0015B970CE|nr:hypothetical protein [Paenarthrobacter nitroguajacolicus]
MAARTIRRVEVLVNETLAGVMDIETDGLSSREHLSFTYADSWMSSAETFEVSPELPLRRGPQSPTQGRDLFGAFQDASPDDWGKKLLFEELRQQAIAKGTGRIPLAPVTVVRREPGADRYIRNAAHPKRRTLRQGRSGPAGVRRCFSTDKERSHWTAAAGRQRGIPLAGGGPQPRS